MPAPPSCFAAIPVVAPERLLHLQGALPAELRPIHPEDMHLTIAYFGRIDPSLHAGVLHALSSLPFEGAATELDQLLPLPHRGHPSALTLTLGRGPSRDRIVSLITEHRPRLLELAGRPADPREPLPHVTFARPRGRKMTEAKRAAILEWADTRAPLGCPLQLTEVVLMRSLPPRETGPYYERVRP